MIVYGWKLIPNFWFQLSRIILDSLHPKKQMSNAKILTREMILLVYDMTWLVERSPVRWVALCLKFETTVGGVPTGTRTHMSVL